MKKIITGIVTLTMALGMTACSDSGENNNSTTTSTATSTATETTTVATTPSEETTTTTSADITTTTEQTTTTTVTTTEETTTTTAKETKEQVLIDSNGIKITFKGMDYSDGIFGPEVKLLIENNTDKNYTVQVRNFSVNGFMIETSMSTDVNALFVFALDPLLVPWRVQLICLAPFLTRQGIRISAFQSFLALRPLSSY